MGNLGNLSPQGSVAVGVIVGLISTSLQAIGLTLQRKSHILEDEKHPYDIRRPPYRRRRWQIGMLMFVISNIVGSTIQITTLPLPVLSTLQASGLVFNTAFATLMLGEPFTRYSFFGTVLVCGGAVLIATFGAVGEPAHSLDQLLELLQRRPFILWMVGTAILMLVILLGSNLIRIISTPPRSKHLSPYPTLLCVRVRVRVPHVQVAPSRVRLVRGMCYGLVSGILSAHSLLLAKSAVELLVRTIVDRVNQFNRWQSWVILLSMIFLALAQLFYLHRGLKLCSTSILYPFVFCVYNIIAILDGLIYFRQASQLAGLHAGLIALGTVVLLSGVLCLSWRLEDIDSHTGVGVIGSSQTALGPGMGVIEPRAETPLGMSSGDEEAQLGEREPLLPHLRFPPQRAPSMPLMGRPLHRQSTTAVNPASIWAELDDSDYDYSVMNRSEILAQPVLEHGDQQTHRRPRSQSSGVVPFSKQDTTGMHYPPLRGTARHSQAGTVGGRRSWDLRRNSPGWRRTSAPVTVDQAGSRWRRRRTFWGPYHIDGSSNSHFKVTSSSSPSQPPSTRAQGYGTVNSDAGATGESRTDQNRPAGHPHNLLTSTSDDNNNHHHQSTIGLLAGSRRTLTGAWRKGLSLVLRGRREPQQQQQQQQEQQQPRSLAGSYEE